MATIILGGGIIGLSTAYYLSLLEPDLAAAHQIHIIDSASDLLLSASGYAGGFLAKDWFTPNVSSLGELSFRLHKELAEANNGSKNWSYMPSIAYSLAIDARGVPGKKSGGADWLLEGTSRANVAPTNGNGEQAVPTGDGAARDETLNADGSPAWFTKQKGGTLDVIDDEGGCAQIEPKQLCQWLIEQCEANGVKIHTNCVATSVVKDEDGKVTGLKVKKDTEIYDKHCKNIVLAAGAWTPRVFSKLFPDSKLRIPIDPLAGYSIVVQSPRYSKPILDPSRHGENAPAGVSHAVYCSPTAKWSFACEAYSRVPADGKPELWAGGVNDSALKLPETADGTPALIDQEKCEELRSAMIAMTGLSQEGDDLAVNDLKIKREGLCFRPLSRSGTPFISSVPETALGKGIEMADKGGVYIASGHGPWGISLGLGTGFVMAEMLTGRKPSADVSRLKLK
ncbi:hypothetical protein OHC33_003624 [Knufia fluminis]|uniref:FAD dependent oxidoreductase domain-containing protein n=1 Tax=Knufia fluminis TaxID=191047 RepID=A0AAN8ES66_9EURO|nr:hypothetical protein OHC33_003624 [Knufia fluminis]